jgi:hypothetical protein
MARGKHHPEAAPFRIFARVNHQDVDDRGLRQRYPEAALSARLRGMRVRLRAFPGEAFDRTSL